VRAKRIQRSIVRTLTRDGPLAVRLLFLVFGIGLVADALVNHGALLAKRTSNLLHSLLDYLGGYD
jgi:hypothetical protein